MILDHIFHEILFIRARDNFNKTLRTYLHAGHKLFKAKHLQAENKTQI